MRRIFRSAATAAVAGLIALLVVLAATPTPRGRAFDVYLLYLGGVVLLALVAATSAAAGGMTKSAFEAALDQPVPHDERPRELERIERDVYLAQTSDFDLHYRLRPTLRSIAAQRLLSERGIDLERRPAAARTLLGEQAWELLRAEREPPERDAPGLTVAELTVLVDALERI